MRLTRAALRAESIEAISIETADASNLSSDLKQRIPLGEVSANSLPDLELEDAQTKKMPPKKLRKGAAKKGAKGNKVEDVEDEGADPQVLEDERQAAGSPASDAAVDELSNGPTDDIVQVPMNDTRPTSPPSRAVRMTRRQLAKFEEEELAKAQSRAALLSPPVDQNTDDAPAVEHEKESPAEPEQEVAETLQLEPSVPEADQAVKTQEPEVAAPTVEEAVEIQEPEVVVPTVEEAAEIQEPEIVALEEEHAEQVHGLGIETAAPIVETVIGTQESELDIPNIVDLPASATAPEANEVEPAQAPEIVEPEVLATSDVEPKTLTNGKSSEENSTPATSRNPSRASSRTPSRSPMRLEESIEAIDALEEALDKVGQAIYLSDHSADEKSPRKARFSDVVGIAPNKRTRPSSVVTPKVSRAPGVIRSLKPPSMPVRTSPARSSSMQVSSKESRKGSGEVSDYLASKRRPISMSFPAPPPPPKSTKPPTRSTFQLPGEAVAAKLKAQKEERLRREAEGEVVERRAVTLPPRPKSTKLPTTSTFQLPGEAVAARLKAQKEERLRREAEGEVVETVFTMPPRPKSTKPPTVATFQLPGEIVAAKLKAQKEERLRREAEGEVVKKPRPMSMPPPPKSTKPPTVANFQLPGEAISAKLRAQKEERLKREEEEATKRSTFKARPAPIRKNIPATVRQTSASIARENLMAKEHQPTSLASKRSSMMGPTPTADKRNSALVTRPAFNLSTTQSSNRNSLLLSQGLSSLTPADAAAQRIKAREQFHKEKVENESKRKDRLSKEDAAKKARDEAAEQGRIRSRLWAEKQKQRALSASVMRVDEGA